MEEVEAAAGGVDLEYRRLLFKSHGSTLRVQKNLSRYKRIRGILRAAGRALGGNWGKHAAEAGGTGAGGAGAAAGGGGGGRMRGQDAKKRGRG